MAFAVSDWFETLVAAANEATQALTFPNPMLDCVFTSMEPNYATLGQSLKVNIPLVDTSLVVDIGAGDIQTFDNTHSTATITFNHKFDRSFIIRDFDQVRTPQNLRQIYLDAEIKAVMNKLDQQLCNLVTSTNFSSYTSITGGSAVFTRSHLVNGWRNLAGAGAPVQDQGNLFFITSHVPYSNMLNDSTLVQANIVGERAAETSRNAVFLPQFNAQLLYDPFFPAPTASTYAGVYLHKYAIALRTGLEAPSNSPVVQETVVSPRGIPIKIQTWYAPESQGQKVNLSVCCGYGVVRPDHGAYFVTA